MLYLNDHLGQELEVSVLGDEMSGARPTVMTAKGVMRHWQYGPRSCHAVGGYYRAMM